MFRTYLQERIDGQLVEWRLDEDNSDPAVLRCEARVLQGNGQPYPNSEWHASLIDWLDNAGSDIAECLRIDHREPFATVS